MSTTGGAGGASTGFAFTSGGGVSASSFANLSAKLAKSAATGLAGAATATAAAGAGLLNIQAPTIPHKTIATPSAPSTSLTGRPPERPICTGPEENSMLASPATDGRVCLAAGPRTVAPRPITAPIGATAGGVNPPASVSPIRSPSPNPPSAPCAAPVMAPLPAGTPFFLGPGACDFAGCGPGSSAARPAAENAWAPRSP